MNSILYTILDFIQMYTFWDSVNYVNNLKMNDGNYYVLIILNISVFEKNQVVQPLMCSYKNKKLKYLFFSRIHSKNSFFFYLTVTSIEVLMMHCYYIG